MRTNNLRTKNEILDRFNNLLNRDINIFGNGLNDKKKERYYSELSILFSSGVDIRSSLELVVEEQLKESEKVLFQGILDNIINGYSLSYAMNITGKFSPYEIYSMQIGEESGRLGQILNELAFYFNRKIKQRRQLTSALTYPIVVFCSSFAAVAFMMKFVVPMFSDVFKRFKGELPYITRLIIKMSNLFSEYFLIGSIVVLLLVVLLYRQRKSVWFRRIGSTLILKTPVFRDLIVKIYLARFCQSMNLLINSKTPLVKAIDLVKNMVEFYPIESSLVEVKNDVLRGESLSKSLSKFKIYNKRLISLIKVAEEVNQLDKMFERVSKQYTEEVEHQIGIFGSLIEPILIIFLGFLVAIILIAIYLPLFQIGNLVG